MTRKRFKIVDYLLATKAWDLFAMMEIGVDRIHHGFWSFHDREHRRFIDGNPYENAIRDYYIFIDEKIGEWLSTLDEETVVLVVSDHGAKRMDGGICINEWLWREGYLSFKSDPPSDKLTRLDDLEIDWSRTRAWGNGGYYGRVFINVEGREPEGVVPMRDYEPFRRGLMDRLAAIPGPDGEDLGTVVYRPSDVYREVKGAAPDLMVYFGNLLWRSVGTLGHGGIHTFENDTGPDDCNHAENGLFILADPNESRPGAQIAGAQLMDVTPSLMDVFGIPRPPEVQGTPLTDLPELVSPKT